MEALVQYVIVALLVGIIALQGRSISKLRKKQDAHLAALEYTAMMMNNNFEVLGNVTSRLMQHTGLQSGESEQGNGSRVRH